MMVGAFIHCPSCGKRVHVQVDERTTSLLTPEGKTAAVLKIAAGHTFKCAEAHEKATGAA